MNEVGQRIHELRKTLGLSQRAFGARLGISHAHISHIESGKENPSLTLQKLVAWEYGVNREWLLTGTGEMLDQWEGVPEKAEEEFPADEFTTIKIVLQHSKLHYLAINGDELDDVLEFSITVGNKPTASYQCVREVPAPRKHRIDGLVSKPQQVPGRELTEGQLTAGEARTIKSLLEELEAMNLEIDPADGKMILPTDPYRPWRKIPKELESVVKYDDRGNTYTSQK